MSGPTFVAKFADGEITRMTTYCPNGQLDLGRGVRLSRTAYQSRKGKEAPPMIEAQFFEPPHDGREAVMLESYSATELAQVRIKPMTPTLTVWPSGNEAVKNHFVD